MHQKTVNLDQNRYIRDQRHVDELLDQSWNK